MPDRETVATDCHRIGRGGLEATPLIPPANQQTEQTPKLPEMANGNAAPVLAC